MSSDTLRKLTRTWRKKPGATAEAVKHFMYAAGILRLPQDYLEFVQYADGASGLVGTQGPWIKLDPLEDVLLHTQVYEVPPELLLFGHANSDRALAFETNGNDVRVIATGFFNFTHREPLGKSLTQALLRLERLERRIKAKAGAATNPDIGWVPTPQDVVEQMLELAGIKKNDLLYDLGCGDGRIIVTAARKYGIRAFGFDIDPDRIRAAQANIEMAGVERLVKVKQANIFTINLRPATVVSLYLLTTVNERLIPQLLRLRPGARIVSNTFTIGDFQVDKEVHLKSKDKANRTIYRWVAPLKE